MPSNILQAASQKKKKKAKNAIETGKPHTSIKKIAFLLELLSRVNILLKQMLAK